MEGRCRFYIVELDLRGLYSCRPPVPGKTTTIFDLNFYSTQMSFTFCVLFLQCEIVRQDQGWNRRRATLMMWKHNYFGTH
jgi:hypothetical protein